MIRPLLCGPILTKYLAGLMVRFLRKIVAITCVATVFGCTSSPWSATKPAAERSEVPEAGTSESASAEAAPTSPSLPGQGTTPDPQAMKDVMAQLQEMGDLEPAVRDRLMEDLKQTDPRLWQGVVRQFRAMLACRQQLNHQQQGKPGQPAASLPVANSAATLTALDSESAAKREERSSAGGNPSQSASRDECNPAPTEVAEKSLSGSVPSEGDRQVKSAARGREAGRVDHASYTDEALDDWQADLERAIRRLEQNVASSPRSAGEVAEHARLRMLYLLADRRDDALRPIPSASPSVQDFWAKELYGLAAWLDTQGIDDPTRRAAEAKLHLSEAINRLGEQSPLIVRNLAFVTDIQSFGSYKPFPECKFTPGQEVLLYAEVENFSSESTSKGYRTSLRFGYQIFDSRGQRVAEHEFTAQEDCLNMRRDFFIGYHFFIPTRIYDGKHTLQLTVEDLHSQKIGQSSIDFTVHQRTR